MQAIADQITEWSRLNLSSINDKKTKEMLFASIMKNLLPQDILDVSCTERVTSRNLLCVTTTNNLSWKAHAGTIYVKLRGRR